MIKDDSFLLAQTEDRIQQADSQYRIVRGDFLDMHQKKVLSDFFRSRSLPVRAIFYGGYPDAERCMPVFIPDYVEMPPEGVPEEVQELLRVVRVTLPRGSRSLTHRDYLGSLLALGLEREVTGDILVRNPDDRTGGGADIIVETEIAEFIELHYAKAGRTNLSVEILPVSQLQQSSFTTEEKRDTVASLRLDCIAASVFGLSRSRAAEAIRRGIVSVNGLEATRVDMVIDPGDKIVMRGKGRAILSEAGGTTRKDRIKVKFSIYR
ncbi:MAG: RNA-binding protein [Lentihominibacter sp.]